MLRAEHQMICRIIIQISFNIMCVCYDVVLAIRSLCCSRKQVVMQMAEKAKSLIKVKVTSGCGV